jgi:hypothetical protein
MTSTAFPDDRERDVRAYLKSRLKAMGGSLRKVSWFPRSNAPDEIVFIPKRAGHYACMVWVELKRPGASPREGQKREIENLRQHGQVVFVIDSREAVDVLLRWS